MGMVFMTRLIGYGMEWNGIGWFGLVWCGLVWFGLGFGFCLAFNVFFYIIDIQVYELS